MLSTPTRWNEVSRGTKIRLEVAQVLPSFNGSPRFLTSGEYYITGFWANVCGLSRTSAHEGNDVVIESHALTAFQNIID